MSPEKQMHVISDNDNYDQNVLIFHVRSFHSLSLRTDQMSSTIIHGPSLLCIACNNTTN